jgi:hypothetical protein
LKRKIIVILVMTLFITTVFPAIGIEIDSKVVKEDNNDIGPVRSDGDNEFISPAPPPKWLIGADQKQTSDCGYGFGIYEEIMFAQEFKPTKDKLTAVALDLFKYNSPSGIELTVSIRDDLKGIDLTTITIDADEADIKSSGTWVLFDFTDISVTPETTYYIICNATGAVLFDIYMWFIDVYDKYDRGIPWFSYNSGKTWMILEDPNYYQPDFSFITYFKKPLNFANNKPVLDFLQGHPNIFPMLQQLMVRFGL